MSTPQQPPRRVLMLCYYFPPAQTVAIARNAGFARELPRHGWSPTVLTVREARDSWSVIGKSAPVPDDVHVERTPEYNLDRALSLLDGAASRVLKNRLGKWRGYWFRDLCAPDPHHGWRVRGRGAELARRSDCIYVSCSPFSNAVAGVSIKRRSGRPLVLDFRDPWTLNPQGPKHLALHRGLVRRMERSCIQAADRVILNTEGTLQLYREQYPEFSDRFACIPNGYDKLNVPAQGDDSSAPFTIMHVGMLYLHRDPEPLLQALVELGLPNVRFVQVGPGHRSLERYRDHLDIHVTGPVPPETATEWMRSASLLYLNQGRRPGNPESVAITAKTYEYLATGLPILADCPPGDNARVVERFACYPYIVSDPDPAALAAAVRDAWERRGERIPAVQRSFVEGFSRSALTAQLAGELNAVCEAHAGATQVNAVAGGRVKEAKDAR